FSSKGARPDPNMMAGGDLDGDIYFCIWDPSLVPKEEFSPMDYTPPTARSLPTDAAHHPHAMGDFFVEFMKNDNLGQIANAHVVFADLNILGPKSTECLKLAALHSTAVDFAKTGVPAVMQPGLIVPKYPDFMENTTKPSYVSTKILGQLYRRAKAAPWGDACLVESKQLFHDVRLLRPGYQAFLAEADWHCYHYSMELWALACFYNVEQEIELVSGYIRKLSRQVCRQRGQRMAQDVSERLERAVRAIQSKYQDIFWAEFQEDRDDDRVLQKAAAWYYTAYTYLWDTGDAPYLSFGWLALEPMCRLLEMVNKKDVAEEP
ncbi:hypothetical protein As57867_008246, partial [Aphanomyces stellatus]